MMKLAAQTALISCPLLTDLAWGAKPAPTRGIPTGKGEIHKWVDEQGITHYGDTLPEEAIKRGTVDLSTKGTVIRQTEGELTAEQRMAREQELARKKAEEDRKKEQKRRDDALLKTFTNVQDIDIALARNMENLDLNIQSTTMRLQVARRTLEARKQEARQWESNGRALPVDLVKQLKASEDEYNQVQKTLTQQQRSKLILQQKYLDDRKRFLELTRSSVASDGAAPPPK
jgi:hypothetical protein